MDWNYDSDEDYNYDEDSNGLLVRRKSKFLRQNSGTDIPHFAFDHGFQKQESIMQSSEEIWTSYKEEQSGLRSQRVTE